MTTLDFYTWWKYPWKIKVKRHFNRENMKVFSMFNSTLKERIKGELQAEENDRGLGKLEGMRSNRWGNLNEHWVYK